MRYLRYTVIVIVYFSLAISAANAGEPLDLVKSMQERAVQLLRDPTLQAKDKEVELNDRLRDILMPMIDVDEMAKRALATHWSRMTAAAQKEFVEMFRGYLESLDRIPSRHASTNLVLERETIQQGFAEVEGYFYFPARRNAPAMYKLHLIDGK